MKKHSKAPIDPSYHHRPQATGRAIAAGQRLVFWYYERYTNTMPEGLVDLRNSSIREEATQAHAPFQMYGNDLLDIYDRFLELDDYERMVLDDLRDKGASIPDLVDYIRAEEGLNAEGKPTRTDIATTIRRKEFLQKSQKIEASGRSAVLLLGAVGLVGLAGVAVSAGLATGVTLAPWVPEAIAFTGEVLNTAAGGGAIMLAWKAWNELHELKHGSPKIEIGKEEEFEDLPHSLGRLNFQKLNEQLESIPSADRHLIKHLSPSEMRVFLMGGDATRLHILRSNPPSFAAKVQAELEPLLHPGDSRLKSLVTVCKTVLTAPWKKDQNDAGIGRLKDRLLAWRSFAQMNEDHNVEKENLKKTPGFRQRGRS